MCAADQADEVDEVQDSTGDTCGLHARAPQYQPHQARHLQGVRDATAEHERT